MKNKATRNNMRGFSLMEMLVTVLILVILFALAMIPISKIQKNLRQTELDSRAEMIFSAVQNRMTRLQAAGQDSYYQPIGTIGVTKLNMIPKDAEKDKYEKTTLAYVTSDSKGVENSAASWIYPETEAEADLWDGNWVVEFDPSSGSVYAVFFSRENMDYTPKDFDDLRDRDNRLENGAKIGYYGGDSVGAAATESLDLTVDVINKDQLLVVASCKVSNKRNDLKFYAVIKDESGHTCSATRFLRNRDRIDEKKSPILRSISEARSLASTAPKTRGAAHARGRAFLGSGRSGFCRPSLCLLPSCGGLPFRLLVRAFCGLLGPFLGLHGLGVLRPAIDAGLPYVRVNVGRPLLAVVGNLRALAICVVCPEGLHPVGELLERVADLCPHGGRLRGFSVLPGVGDVMDGAVELPLVLDDVARLASPILVPCDKELGIFCDGGVVELLGLGRFNEHKLGDGLGGVTPLLSVRDCLDGLLRC